MAINVHVWLDELILAPPEAAVHRKRPGNPEVAVGVDVCNEVICGS
jgi:hypothetical protein